MDVSLWPNQVMLHRDKCFHTWIQRGSNNLNTGYVHLLQQSLHWAYKRTWIGACWITFHTWVSYCSSLPRVYVHLGNIGIRWTMISRRCSIEFISGERWQARVSQQCLHRLERSSFGCLYRFLGKSNMAAKPCDQWHHMWNFSSSWTGGHTCKVSPRSVQQLQRRGLFKVCFF